MKSILRTISGTCTTDWDVAVKHAHSASIASWPFRLKVILSLGAALILVEWNYFLASHCVCLFHKFTSKLRSMQLAPNLRLSPCQYLKMKCSGSFLASCLEGKSSAWEEETAGVRSGGIEEDSSLWHLGLTSVKVSGWSGASSRIDG